MNLHFDRLSDFDVYIDILAKQGFYENGVELPKDFGLAKHDVADHYVCPEHPFTTSYIPPTPVGEVYATVNSMARMGPLLSPERYEVAAEAVASGLKANFELSYKLHPPNYGWYLECRRLWHGDGQHPLTRGLKAALEN